MHDHQQKKKFLNLPKFPGGSKAFKEFIVNHMRYPKEAVEAGVEGSVIVGYEVDDDGRVLSPHILKGIGHGCDEEALRLISMLSFEKARNRGMRVRITSKTKINFRLPKTTVSYTYTSGAKKENDKKGGTTYGYTIKF